MTPETIKAAMAHVIAMALKPRPVLAPAIGKAILAALDPGNLEFGMTALTGGLS